MWRCQVIMCSCDQSVTIENNEPNLKQQLKKVSWLASWLYKEFIHWLLIHWIRVLTHTLLIYKTEVLHKCLDLIIEPTRLLNGKLTHKLSEKMFSFRKNLKICLQEHFWLKHFPVALLLTIKWYFTASLDAWDAYPP